MKIVDSVYPYGEKTVGIALFLAFLWLIFCGLVTGILGINFDIEAIRGLSDSLLQESTSNCEDLDIPIETSINVQSTQTFIGLHPSEIVGKDLYNSLSDSGVLLLNTFLGYLLSLFISEPIFMFVYALACVLMHDAFGGKGHLSDELESDEGDEKNRKEKITEDDFVRDPQFVLASLFGDDSFHI